MLCEDLEGCGGRCGREEQEGGETCILMADSCCCTAETNTTLKSSYPLIKNKIKREYSESWSVTAVLL